MADELTIVIATSGRPDLLDRTLGSLSACRKPDTYRETIVVENGPRAGAESVVCSYHPRLKSRYVYSLRANKSSALNHVLETVKDTLIVFTDDDVRLHPETIWAYDRAAAGISRGQFYGGPTGVDYQQEPPDWLKVYLPPSARGWSLDEKTQIIDTPPARFLGFNWAAFANDLIEHGGFDAKFGPGSATRSTGQEQQMQDRLLAGGLVGKYVPEAMVWHYVPKKRCTPRWTLFRAYRNGVEAGLRKGPPVQNIFSYPPWMLRAWRKKALKAIRLTRKRRDLPTRFKAYLLFSHYCGYLQGVRMINNNKFSSN